MSADEAVSIRTTRINGRDIEIREIIPGLFNAFDINAGLRIAVILRQPGGWWRRVRTDAEPAGLARNPRLPEGGAETALRRLLAT